MSEKKQSPFSFIARLFWPREAVALANKFETEETANKEAVNIFEYQTYKYILFFSVIIPSACWLFGEPSLMLLTLLLSPFIIRWSLRDIFYRFILVYSCGQTQTATVAQLSLVGFYGGQIIAYKIHCDQITVTSSWAGPIYSKNSLPQQGDLVSVCYYPKGKKFKVVPDLQDLKEKYSFTTYDASPS